MSEIIQAHYALQVCCPQEHVAELDALLVAVSGHLNRHAATSKAQGHAAHCLDGLQAVLHTAALTLEALLLVRHVHLCSDAPARASRQGYTCERLPATATTSC